MSWRVLLYVPLVLIALAVVWIGFKAAEALNIERRATARGRDPLWRVEFRTVAGRTSATVPEWRPSGDDRFLFRCDYSELAWREFYDRCEDVGLAVFVELPLEDPIVLSGWLPRPDGKWSRLTPWGEIVVAYEHAPDRWSLGCVNAAGVPIDGPLSGPPKSRTEALLAADRWVEDNTPQEVER